MKGLHLDPLYFEFSQFTIQTLDMCQINSFVNFLFKMPLSGSHDMHVSLIKNKQKKNLVKCLLLLEREREREREPLTQSPFFVTSEDFSQLSTPLSFDLSSKPVPPLDISLPLCLQHQLWSCVVTDVEVHTSTYCYDPKCSTLIKYGFEHVFISWGRFVSFGIRATHHVEYGLDRNMGYGSMHYNKISLLQQVLLQQK